MGVFDRAVVGAVKLVLLVCSIYVGMAMQETAYLAGAGLLAFAALRYVYPPLGRRDPAH
jgi:hypothetical protein